MRVISKPTINPAIIFSKCLNSINSRTQRNKFRRVKNRIITESKDFDNKASVGTLYTITTHDDVLGIVTKDEMKKLYTEQMVPIKKKKGRKIYDRLMSLAPLNICPFCGIGTVRTLDHYLPKAKFPTYSVLSYNLIPCCMECNKDKSTDYAIVQEKQTLHPYYDDYTGEQWLFAKVEQTSPVSIRFFVNAPNEWDFIEKSRVEVHFIEYNLGKRFSIQSSNELANLKEEFILFSLNKDDIKKELNKKATIFKNRHLNSWESALYQALAESDWYCSGGYN